MAHPIAHPAPMAHAQSVARRPNVRLAERNWAIRRSRSDRHHDILLAKHCAIKGDYRHPGEAQRIRQDVRLKRVVNSMQLPFHIIPLDDPLHTPPGSVQASDRLRDFKNSDAMDSAESRNLLQAEIGKLHDIAGDIMISRAITPKFRHGPGFVDFFRHRSASENERLDRNTILSFWAEKLRFISKGGYHFTALPKVVISSNSREEAP